MADAVQGRTKVLLLAGDVRDEWKRALEAAGFDVRVAGWLDALPAARTEGPDVVVVSGDLPPQAPQLVVNALRGSGSSHVPVVVAGAPEPERFPPFAATAGLADRYVASPVVPEALARAVAEAVGKRRRFFLGSAPAAGFSVMGLALLATSALGSGAGSALRTVLEVVGAGSIAVGLALTLRHEGGKGPLTIGEWRRFFGAVGFWTLCLVPYPLGTHWSEPICFTVAFAAWAAWAWLVARSKERPLRWLALAVVLLAVAAAPWVAAIAR